MKKMLIGIAALILGCITLVGITTTPANAAPVVSAPVACSNPGVSGTLQVKKVGSVFQVKAAVVDSGNRTWNWTILNILALQASGTNVGSFNVTRTAYPAGLLVFQNQIKFTATSANGKIVCIGQVNL
jgi:hypothetical protein